MEDSKILSGFVDLPAQRKKPAPGRLLEPVVADEELVFEACQPGVMLRSVLFVETVVCVAALFFDPLGWDWVVRASTLTAAAVPALLAWLLAVCSLKRVLARVSLNAQWFLGSLLGGFCGLFGFGLLFLLDLAVLANWLPSAASGALIAYVIVAALVWRTKARTPATTTARLAELQARIRPHFLFNTLNSAIALVRQEPAKAEHLLEDLSELFRYALTATQEAVPLRDELDLAERYLAIEKVRFGDRLRVEWSIDESTLAAKLPPLILQPLVENAVKHGVEPSEAGATVRVSTKRRRDVVILKVTNTVPSGAGARGNGLALNNVRDRLRLLHDLQGNFRYALVDGVFQTRLEIPL
ncbi:sensor histidine kinase [Hydrogenophaga sp. 5NK40-0174]|uniref:sensor histidine kinase n=1 Tax=Hydrogenophaga sp. 5NK40-0174 TaxID=3127649 RepID=UPI0031022E40